jgi:mRNA interferase MazF
LKQGDIIKINLDPTVGNEQAGYRPAVVISNDFMIKQTNIVLICPITNAMPKYPTHIALDNACKNITGCVLCEHTRAVDVVGRSYKHVDELPVNLLREIVDVVYSLVEVQK